MGFNTENERKTWDHKGGMDVSGQLPPAPAGTTDFEGPNPLVTKLPLLAHGLVRMASLTLPRLHSEPLCSTWVT